MAAETLRWGPPELLTLFVAAFAGDRRMCAFESEVGGGVGECLAVELHDVRTAALMFAMTDLAFRCHNVGPFPVQTALGRDVACNLLVALEAKPALAFL